MWLEVRSSTRKRCCRRSTRATSGVAALDVYVGEFERPPPEALWAHERVLVTPHTSAMSDESRHRAIELFCANLQAYLDGAPLENVLDWQKGY